MVSLGPARTSRPTLVLQGNPSWHMSQRWGNFGAIRTTPTLSAPSTSASQWGGRPHLRTPNLRGVLGPVHSAASVPRGRRRPMGWRRLLPARRGDGRTRTLGGQGSQVAHSCEQRGLQARARALCGQHQVDGDPVDRQPKPDHSATGKVPDLPRWQIDHGQVLTPPGAGWSGKKRSQGKLEVDAPDAKRRKCCTDNAMEPVCFYSMPETFYTERHCGRY